MPLRMDPGNLIILEGIDFSGKSTLAKGLQAQDWLPPVPLFTHSPSGGSEFTETIYKFLELEDKLHPLTRQFLHLACHTQMYRDVIYPALDKQAVFLDRNWLSTIAYGFFAGNLRQHISLEQFEAMARLPAEVDKRYQWPRLILLCTHPYGKDKHNTPALLKGYEYLHAKYKTTLVPQGSPQEVLDWTINTMKEKGIIEHVDV